MHADEKSDAEAPHVHRDLAKAVNLPAHQKLHFRAKFKAVLNSTGAVLVYTVNECGFGWDFSKSKGKIETNHLSKLLSPSLL